MGLGDQLTAAISDIYDAIAYYDYSDEFQPELVESLATLSYTLLKVDNPDKEIGIRELNLLRDNTKQRVEAAIRGQNPWAASLMPRFVLRRNLVERDGPVLQDLKKG